MKDLLDWSRSILETTPSRWISLVQHVPIPLLTRPPAQGEWSALECLFHLMDTERYVFPARVVYFLEGKDFPAFHPDKAASALGAASEPLGLAKEFSRLREESLRVFARIEAADLVRAARHQELGVVTLDQMLNEWAGHDLMHTVQAEQSLMQPFIEGCGPWRPYFSKHDLSES